MLTTLAHAGAPPEPHDLATAWTADPVVISGLALAVWLYERGRARGDAASTSAVRRRRMFLTAVGVVAVALLSPIDAASAALASAHMLQHVLLLLVAAPLFALAAPGAAIARGLPRRWVRAVGGDGRAGVGRRWSAPLRNPVVVLVLHVVTLWVWHAAAVYQLALDNGVVHAVEHATFLGTAVLLWRVVAGPATARRTSGVEVALVFLLALQSVFLSALITFANEAWYAGYAGTTAPFGMTPLADQQLAGVLMWIPGGLVYVGTGVALFTRWVRGSEGGIGSERSRVEPAG